MENRGAHVRRVCQLLIALTAVLFASFPFAGTKPPDSASFQSSVVKLYVSSHPPDLLAPWQSSGIEALTGSGVVIDGNRILTAAHVVDNAVSIEVKRHGVSDRFVATIEYIGHDCDLAVLSVDDESLFANARPISIGSTALVEQRVQVLGFPIGGESLSVTSGIVSRIEAGLYTHSMEWLLQAQIDAAVNAGNSGGPVLADGRLVGIVTETLDEAENIGYMAPVPVIEHFLTDLADGEVTGFPRPGFAVQGLESDTQKRSLGLGDNGSGVLITQVDRGGPAEGVLRPGDVILAMDGVPVANDMTASLPEVGRVDSSEIIRLRQVGETIPVSILRSGRTTKLQLPVQLHHPLVPGRIDDEPEYLVFGGLVFQPLTMDYLYYFEEIPSDLSYYAFYNNFVTTNRRQLILIQTVLPHAVNRGYQDWADVIIASVNGVVPRDMRHLAELIDDAKGPWIQITTDEHAVLTLDLDKARQVHAKLLERYGIARDRSAKLGLSEKLHGGS